MQLLAPAAAVAYQPAMHGVHCEAPVGAMDPASQSRQLDCPVALAKRPAEQLLHVELPLVVVYMPTLHGEQLEELDFDAKEPAAHGVQAVAAVWLE